VTHVRSRGLIHEGSVLAIGFGQTDLVGNVGVDSLVGSGLGREGRVVLLHQLLLHSDAALLIVSFLVSDHLQVLDLGLRSRGQTFLHSFLCVLVRFLQFLPLVLVLYDVGLAHAQLRYCRLHLAGQLSQTTLEFVDLFAHFQSRLPALSGVLLEFVDQVAHLVKNKFLL
jgi:hypothetical protein